MNRASQFLINLDYYDIWSKSIIFTFSYIYDNKISSQLSIDCFHCKFHSPLSVSLPPPPPPPPHRSDSREIYSLCLEINLNTFKITLLGETLLTKYNGNQDGKIRFKRGKKKMARRKKKKIQFPRSSASNGKHSWRDRLQIWIINRATQWAGREGRQRAFEISTNLSFEKRANINAAYYPEQRVRPLFATHFAPGTKGKRKCLRIGPKASQGARNLSDSARPRLSD